MQSKARMTIRFEQPQTHTKLQQQPKPIEPPDVPERNLFTDQEEAVIIEDFTTWHSPFQDDIHALEEIIRTSEIVNRTAVEPVHESVNKYLDMPVLESVDELDKQDMLSADRWGMNKPEFGREKHAGARRNHRTVIDREQGPSWGRVFLSVAAAIATGALFGYMVLSLFTGEPLFPGKLNAVTQLPAQATLDKAGASSTDPTVIPKSSPNVDVPSGSAQPLEDEAAASETELASNVYYMLQYGVFQSKESKEEAVKQLQEKGLASASENSDGYRVYAGTARSREEAELLAAQMPGTEVYIKAIGGEQLLITSSMLSNAGVEFINASMALTRKLAQYSGTGLQDQQPSKLSAAEETSLQLAHQQWLKSIPAVDKLDSTLLQEGKEIIQALNSAVQSMTEFNRKPSRFDLWSVQSSVMKALLADRHMRLILQSSLES